MQGWEADAYKAVEGLFLQDSSTAGFLEILSESEFATLSASDQSLQDQATLHDFAAQANRLLVVRGPDGSPHAYLGVGAGQPRATAFRSAPSRLPPGDWRIIPPAGLNPLDCVVQFGLGAYQFPGWKTAWRDLGVRLVAADLRDEALRIVRACALARDLVNCPASHLGPADLEAHARALASEFKASMTCTTGDALLADGYPAVHAVGRAAAKDRAPRMIELCWTSAEAPAEPPVVAVIGKGVTFDTGGLDLKPSSAMRLMKKDMGGAAHALALSRMIMEAKLPIRLHTLIPAVENAVSGSAMRPGDVIATRKGLSVEIGNTDAEGRLILADALARAGELSPEVTISLATLTGAARVALGPEVVPFYTDQDLLAEALADAAQATFDPLWRMPLWGGYEDALSSDIADLKNDPDGWAQAGSVTAALFLKRFAPSGDFVHFDIFAWNPKAGPGRPVGAEAQAIRALDHYLCHRFHAA